MSYQLKRITTVPGTPVVIAVTDRRGHEKDAGLADGGQFVFPVGGDAQDVSDWSCQAIMGDPGTARHFKCTPPWLGVSAPLPTPEAAGATEDTEGPEERPEANNATEAEHTASGWHPEEGLR